MKVIVSIEHELTSNLINIKRDIKRCEIDTDYLIQEISYKIIKVDDVKKVGNIIYSHPSHPKICLSKIRIQDIKNNKGSSGGYRVISLLDGIQSVCICLLLHVYNKKEKENFSKKERKELIKIVTEYTRENYINE